MSNSPFFSFLSSLDWSGAMQWYASHVNVGYLLAMWQQGSGFSSDDWLGIALLGGNMLVLVALISTLVQLHQAEGVRNWIDRKRSQLAEKTMPKKRRVESRTVLEAKIVKNSDLQKAYNLHKLAMYEPALKMYSMALKAAPYELNTWLVGIKIVSEMDEPNQPFVQYLKKGIEQLHQKRPDLWKELARYGREKAPGLDQWQPA